MSDREFRVAGAICLAGSHVQGRTLGVVVFSDANRSYNQLFVGIEDRHGTLQRFVPLDSDDAYERFIGVGGCSKFLGKTEPQNKIHVGDGQVFCLIDGERLHFFDKTISASSEIEDVEFFKSIVEGSSYAEYSLRGRFSESLSKKYDDVSRMATAVGDTWKQAEIGFFQRSSSYWKIVERAGFSSKPGGDSKLASFSGRDEMLSWLMANPSGYFEENYDKWVGAWLYLSDFSRHQEIIETLGLGFVADSQITNHDVLRVLRRIGVNLHSREAESAVLSILAELSNPQSLSDWSSSEVYTAVEIHRHVTGRLFGDRAMTKVSLGSGLDADISSLRQWAKSCLAGRKKTIASPTDQSMSYEWLTTSSGFMSQLAEHFPGPARLVAMALRDALGRRSEELTLGELTLDELESAYAVIAEDVIGAFSDKSEQA